MTSQELFNKFFSKGKPYWFFFRNQKENQSRKEYRKWNM